MEDSDTVATQRPDLIRPRVVLTIGGVTCVLCKRELQAAVAAGDGYSYCRPCILDWFRAHERDGSQVSSPVTGEALSDKLLLPNLNLRETILSVQQALKTWDEAEAERTSLRAEVQKLLGEGHSRKLQNVDPRVAEAQAQAAHFERQVLNQKQEVQRLQMELDRYHHVMEERDFSGLDAKAAELSLVAAELRSSMVEVNRLEDELEKTRQQAKLQATELEELRTSQRDAFFTEQMLRQELARVKDEFSGKLTVGGAKDHSFELNKARHELLKSQVLVVDLQNQLRAARREPPAPSSPKALEIPQENQFQSELFEMKQSLSKQDNLVAELQTQITALRSQNSGLKQLAELREQRRLEAQDEILRLRGELLTIDRRTAVTTELERTTELATREAERLEEEVVVLQKRLEEQQRKFRDLVSSLGGEPSPDNVEVALRTKVLQLQKQFKDRGDLLRTVAKGLGAKEEVPETDLKPFFQSKARQAKSRTDQLSALAKLLGSSGELHESELADFVQSKVKDLHRQVKDRDELLSELSFVAADFLEDLGLADLDPPEDACAAARLVTGALLSVEDKASALRKAASSSTSQEKKDEKKEKSKDDEDDYEYEDDDDEVGTY
ncbi:unnamed protein product [Durusdinium trenchii]|uniref:Uncharacterized protein n=2 Tax=Durusdinium trenchii TaxID=1381693 RepID=A0ABP0H9I6_9DINO